jgi:hypothetical protein
MKKSLVILVLVASLILSACSQAQSSQLVASADLTPTTTAPETVAEDPTLPQLTATQPDLAAAPALTTTPVPLGDPMPGCSVISFNPTPEPTLQALFPPPGEDDWTLGSEKAAVTIVEYGDFQ